MCASAGVSGGKRRVSRRDGDGDPATTRRPYRARPHPCHGPQQQLYRWPTPTTTTGSTRRTRRTTTTTRHTAPPLVRQPPRHTPAPCRWSDNKPRHATQPRCWPDTWCFTPKSCPVSSGANDHDAPSASGERQTPTSANGRGPSASASCEREAARGEKTPDRSRPRGARGTRREMHGSTAAVTVRRQADTTTPRSPEAPPRRPRPKNDPHIRLAPISERDATRARARARRRPECVAATRPPTDLRDDHHDADREQEERARRAQAERVEQQAWDEGSLTCFVHRHCEQDPGGGSVTSAHVAAKRRSHQRMSRHRRDMC